MSEDYLIILNSMNEINFKYGDRSFETIDRIKESGDLKSILQKNGAEISFRNILIDFFEKMSSPRFDNYPYTKKLVLYNHNDLIECYRRYSYELGSLFDCKDAIISFPSFIKAASTYYGIHPFADLSIEKLDLLLSQTIDIKHEFNLNSRVGREDKGMTIYREGLRTKGGEFETIPAYHDHVDSSIYSKFESDSIFEPSLKLGIEAEKISVSLFKSGYTQWVSKEYGDGYGFDIINLKEKKGMEYLIEAKARYCSEDFSLTRVEHKVMAETASLKHTKYHIHKYNFSNSGKLISFHIYKYDKENNILVDEQDSTQICRIIPSFDNNDMSKPVFRCQFEKLDKPLTKTKKSL